MKKDDLIKEIRDRFEESATFWDETFTDMTDDLNFVNGDQWPSDMKKDREVDGRPCLTINKLANYGDQVIGDIRQNEPAITVKPVDSGSDPQVAEILTGLIRNIEIQSTAEIAYDTAAESAVWCGKGTFRVITEYAGEDTFDQDIRIKRIKNPFSVYWDPAATEWDMSDAKYCFITERIPRDEFKRLYPDAGLSEFSASKDKNSYWSDEKTIRIAEYFKKENVKKTIYLLKNPVTGMETVQDTKVEGAEVLQERKIETHKIVWYKTNGREILDGPTDWPGKYIPICEVWGKELNIEGKTVYRGVIRNAKDPQRLYNYSRSHGAEVTALAPKAPYLVTARMINNYQPHWNTAHKKNWPYLPYDVDPAAPSVMPKRSEPPMQSTAIMQEITIADQELHDTTGLQQSNLGQKSNESSGRAILARQREGDVANYTYYDNLGRAMTYCGKVLLDLIPKIYDSARIVRIIGETGDDQFVPVNQPVQTQDENGQAIEKVFDLTVGKYDVVVSIGPSYSTQREEAAANMLEFLKVVPDAGPLIADLLTKQFDWPGADEISERLKALAPQPPPQDMGQMPPDPSVEQQMMAGRAEIERKLLENRRLRGEISREEMGIPGGAGQQQRSSQTTARRAGGGGGR